MNEVNGLLKDGLKLRDVTVESAERKTNVSESKSGVIVAKLINKDDKNKVMKNKSKLMDSRKYDKVFIEHDNAKHQLVLNANIRTIAKTLGTRDLYTA